MFIMNSCKCKKNTHFFLIFFLLIKRKYNDIHIEKNINYCKIYLMRNTDISLKLTFYKKRIEIMPVCKTFFTK